MTVPAICHSGLDPDSTAPLPGRMNVQQTPTFSTWLQELTDDGARTQIWKRISQFQLGQVGQVNSVGEGIREAHIDYGPGYRLYFVARADELFILHCSGVKDGRQGDIDLAKELKKEI